MGGGGGGTGAQKGSLSASRSNGLRGRRTPHVRLFGKNGVRPVPPVPQDCPARPEWTSDHVLPPRSFYWLLYPLPRAALTSRHKPGAPNQRTVFSQFGGTEARNQGVGGAGASGGSEGAPAPCLQLGHEDEDSDSRPLCISGPRAGLAQRGRI